MSLEIRAYVLKGKSDLKDMAVLTSHSLNILFLQLCSPYLFNSVNAFQLISQSLGRNSQKTKSLRLKFCYLHCNLASTPIL